jgi:uncharacterized protein YuzE
MQTCKLEYGIRPAHNRSKMAKQSAEAVGVRYDYQPDVDLLFAWIGEPQVAENVEVETGIYVRVIPATKQVVGIEVVDCAERFQTDPATIDAKFAEALIGRFTKPALERLAEINPHPSLFSSPQ